MVEKATEKARQTEQQAAAAASAAVIEGHEELLALSRDSMDGLARASQALLDGAAEIGHLWTTFWGEQLTDGMEALRALGHCRTWREALEIQNEFAHASLERTCARATRSTEVAAGMVTGSFKPLQESARRAVDRSPHPAA